MKIGYCLDYCLSYLVPLCQRILNLKDIEELVVESTAIGVMYKIAEHWKNLFVSLTKTQVLPKHHCPLMSHLFGPLVHK